MNLLKTWASASSQSQASKTSKPNLSKHWESLLPESNSVLEINSSGHHTNPNSNSCLYNNRNFIQNPNSIETQDTKLKPEFAIGVNYSTDGFPTIGVFELTISSKSIEIERLKKSYTDVIVASDREDLDSKVMSLYSSSKLSLL